MHYDSENLLIEARSKIIKFNDFHLTRLQNIRPIVTKGSFDILHYGHISLLSFCASLKYDFCGENDVVRPLVVLLESSESVTIRKGRSRPYLTESDRAMQIALQTNIDLVIIIDFSDLALALSQLCPHTYVKGCDTVVNMSDKLDKSAILKGNPDIAMAITKGSLVYLFSDDGSISSTRIVSEIAASSMLSSEDSMK